MGAASSIDASRVQDMSPEELSAARRGVEQHVSRLEAENEALKARIAALEAGPTRPRPRRNVSAEESTASLPAELQGLDALSASIAAPDALAERSRAAAESPDDEAARRALAESVEEAMRDVSEAFASQAGRPGVVTMCDAAIAAGDDDFLSVYKVMWDRIARHTDELKAYETAVASVRRLSLTATAVTQGTESIAELVAAAGRVKARFDQHMSSLGGSIKGARCSLPDKLKRTSRIVEKAFCQGTCSRIFDVVRCMIVVDDMSVAAAALSCISDSAEVEIVRIKERFVREPTSGGWRDCMINGRFEGSPHVWEVQIVHRELLVARRGLPGHAIYNRVRTAIELLEKMGLEKDDRAARVATLQKASGETAKDFRAKGVEAADLVAAACFEPFELKDAGLGADEMSAAGLPLARILEAGFDASELRGCSDADDPGALLQAGYDFEEVAAAFRIDARDRDRLALLHVMHAVGCAEELKRKGWGGEKLTTWSGVKTKGKGRVVELDLSGLKANGSLPALPETIKELQYLERLSLKGNDKLVGPLPRGLGFLDHLSELNLAGTGLRFPGTGVPASKRVADREKVAAFCERLFYVHVADATFGKSDLQNIRWNGLSVDGKTPKGAGVLRGWIAVAVEGKRVDGSLDKFETALEAAARTIAPTISFYGRAPWGFDGSKDRKSPKFECIDARTAFALEEARAAGRHEVSLRLDTKAGKGRTYDFDLVNMTQCYRATAHDNHTYKPRAIKRYEFGTPEWSEYARASHASSLRNISD